MKSKNLSRCVCDPSFCFFLCGMTITLLCFLMLSYDLTNQQDSKKMKRSLEEEQRARKDLEIVVRKVLKNINDPSWDETNL